MKLSPRSISASILFCSLLAVIDSPAQAPEPPQATTSTIVVNVNRVLMPVVVRDKQGRAIGDLKEEDFQVFNNDKPQSLSGFTVERHTRTDSVTGSSTTPPDPTTAVPSSSQLPERIIVFLFDDMHLSAEELVRVQKAGARVLADALTGSDMAAVVSLSGKTNSGLTRDRAKLQDAILGLKPRGIYRSSLADCVNLSYYQADLIEDKHDSGALAEAVRQVFNCNPGMDRQREIDTAERLAESSAMQVQMVGRQDIQTTYATLREIVRRMSTLPGQRALVLVSPGFLTVDAQALTAESQIIGLAAQSNVIISAIDARGLYTTSMTASDHSVGDAQYQAELRRAAMSAAENPLAELADGTGGVYLHNSNDLDAGFKRLAQPPEYVYMLELSLDNVKPDGAYHRLKVRVNREGAQLQARQGYFSPKPPKPAKGSK